MYNINQEIITTDFFVDFLGLPPVNVRVKILKMIITFIIECWVLRVFLVSVFFGGGCLFLFLPMLPKTVHGSSCYLELNYPLHLLVGWECD